MTLHLLRPQQLADARLAPRAFHLSSNLPCMHFAFTVSLLKSATMCNLQFALVAYETTTRLSG